MDMKKEFVQVYGYCVEDGVAGDFAERGPDTQIRVADVRRIAVYTSFEQLSLGGVRSIFRTHLGENEYTHKFWKKFCLMLCTDFSCTCGNVLRGFDKCTCDFSKVLPLVEVWTKTGKYFVAGDDRFRFVERK